MIPLNFSVLLSPSLSVNSHNDHKPLLLESRQRLLKLTAVLHRRLPVDHAWCCCLVTSHQSALLSDVTSVALRRKLIELQLFSDVVKSSIIARFACLRRCQSKDSLKRASARDADLLLRSTLCAEMLPILLRSSLRLARNCLKASRRISLLAAAAE